MGVLEPNRRQILAMQQRREEARQRVRLDRTMCAIAALLVVLFVLDIYLRLR